MDGQKPVPIRTSVGDEDAVKESGCTLCIVVAYSLPATIHVKICSRGC